ncbi:hypothetical protein PQI66_00290 [Corynebacterium sp. USCH3]|uniref:hypothetical protein n=1 Tax=Corynebacterium sp. USCH3 TaxID=3024840 RepID=UPI00309D5A46
MTYAHPYGDLPPVTTHHRPPPPRTQQWAVVDLPAGTTPDDDLDDLVPVTSWTADRVATLRAQRIRLVTGTACAVSTRFVPGQAA